MQSWSPNHPELYASVVKDVPENIVELLKQRHFKKHGKPAEAGVERSWRESLWPFITKLKESGFADHGIVLEMDMPQLREHLDALLVGSTPAGNPALTVVEFKGYPNVKPEQIRGSQRQAANYQTFLSHYHSLLTKDFPNSHVSACVYLHNQTANYNSADSYPLDSDYVRSLYLIEQAPAVFGPGAENELMDFLRDRTGNVTDSVDELLEGMSTGFMSPSVDVIRSFAEVIKGNPSLIPLGDQSSACDKILSDYEAAQKRTEPSLFIVHGGPGTGKTVLAMNIMRYLSEIDDEKNRTSNFCYATPGGGTVFALQYLLTGSPTPRDMSPTRGMLHFTGKLPKKRELKAVLIDEAHRLKRYNILGSLGAAHYSIVLLDELQAITPGCIKSIEELETMAKRAGYNVRSTTLAQQLRYLGGENWVQWVNHALEIPDTTTPRKWGQSDIFPAMVTDNAHQLEQILEDLNRDGHKCRFTAGFCWETEQGVNIPGFSRRWYTHTPFKKKTWGILPEGFNYVGAPYFSQNFEFDYVGVIIGPDLRFDGKKITTHQKATKDRELKSCSAEEFGLLAKNIYRMLMTRGRKGCFIHCEDSALREFLKDKIDTNMSRSFPQEAVARATSDFLKHKQSVLS